MFAKLRAQETVSKTFKTKYWYTYHLKRKETREQRARIFNFFIYTYPIRRKDHQFNGLDHQTMSTTGMTTPKEQMHRRLATEHEICCIITPKITYLKNTCKKITSFSSLTHFLSYNAR